MSQVFFITINNVFGIGIFQNTTYVFQIAGAGYGALAFAVVSVVAICVVEPAGEMLQLFPISNARVEFVRAFVDEDLAALVGTGYWLSYAIMLNSLIVSATNLLKLFTPVAYSLMPPWLLFILLINLLPARRYGQLQMLFGTLKILSLVVLLSFVAYGASKNSFDGSKLVLSFSPDGVAAKTDAQAMCMAIALAAPAFVGIESIASMSAEARDTFKVVPSVRSITFLVVGTAVLFGAISGSTGFRNSSLITSYTNQGLGTLVPPPHLDESMHTGQDNLPAMLAVLHFDHTAQTAMNVLLIFSALSAANTALYVSSRTLFATCREPSFGKSVIQKLLRQIGNVHNRTRVPVQAIFWTVVVLIWMCVLEMLNSDEYFNIIQLATNTAIVTCLLIWACQCAAYIRFYRLCLKHQKYLPLEFAPKHTKHALHSFSWSFRPFVACLGLLGCVLILICTTAIFWHGRNNTENYIWTFCGLYSSPIVAATLWVGLKLYRACYIGTKSQKKRWTGLYKKFHSPRQFQETITELLSEIHPADYPVEADDFPVPLSDVGAEIASSVTRSLPPCSSVGSFCSPARVEINDFMPIAHVIPDDSDHMPRAVANSKPKSKSTVQPQSIDDLAPVISQGRDHDPPTGAPSTCVPLRVLSCISVDVFESDKPRADGRLRRG